MPDQCCKGYNGSATGLKKSTINNQKVKAARRMVEVWWQPLDEAGNMVTAMATAMATRMRKAMGTSM